MDSLKERKVLIKSLNSSDLVQLVDITGETTTKNRPDQKSALIYIKSLLVLTVRAHGSGVFLHVGEACVGSAEINQVSTKPPNLLEGLKWDSNCEDEEICGREDEWRKVTG